MTGDSENTEPTKHSKELQAALELLGKIEITENITEKELQNILSLIEDASTRIKAYCADGNTEQSNDNEE